MNRTVLTAMAMAVVLQLPQAPLALEPLTSLIVQAQDSATAARAVRHAGGTVVDDLAIINAVGALIPNSRVKVLEADPQVRRVYADGAVEVAAISSPPLPSIPDAASPADTSYPTLVGADRLHSEGITGAGVTIAVLDSGLTDYQALTNGLDGTYRVVAHYDALPPTKPKTFGEWTLGTGTDVDDKDWAVGLTGALLDVPPDIIAPTPAGTADGYGHGTHVTSVIASRLKERASSKLNGVAPGASLVIVRAFPAGGQGKYSDVIRGIDWVVSQKDVYNIRILNLSLSAPPRSYYWDDPLNQAVMKAWEQGIVVVASAGNRGPNPMTIGVPGNVPYVITVGATSDSSTPSNPSDDVLASFSSAGPSYERFVKPEVVAPGGNLLGLLDRTSTLGKARPQGYTGNNDYFRMSGTSQAAAVVSGIAALILQRDPFLSPDDVKCRLLMSSHVALNANGTPTYSVFQQGAGRVDAYAAAHGTTVGCANRGLDVTLDLQGVHYAGPARMDGAGNFFLAGAAGEGTTWTGAYSTGTAVVWTSGELWPSNELWPAGELWPTGELWPANELWPAGVWPDGVPPGVPSASTGLSDLGAPASVTAWIEPVVR